MIDNLAAKDLLTPEEIEEAETVQYIYAYSDKQLGIFADPFFAEQEPKNVAAGIRGAIIKGSMKPEVAKGSILWLLGVYHRKSGIIEAYEVPQKLIDLAVFVPTEDVEDGRKA